MQTLSTPKILGIVIGLLAVLGAVYVFMQDSVTPSSETTMEMDSETGTRGDAAPMNGDVVQGTETTVEGEEQGLASRGSFKDLLGMSGAQKCSVSQSSAISKSTGTFYFSGGKGRGTFESTVLSGPGAGVVTKNSMIMQGETIHVWDESTKQGMTMSVAATPGASGAASSNSVAEQFNQAYDYDCERWVADPSMFVVPADVTFMDMAEMMKGLPGMDIPGL